MKHSSTLSSEDTSSNKQEENSKRFHSPFCKGKYRKKIFDANPGTYPKNGSPPKRSIRVASE